MMTWLDTRKGVSQSRTESSLHNTYDTLVYVTDKYTDYPLFGVMYAHARAMYTRPPFPQEKRPGIEANLTPTLGLDSRLTNSVQTKPETDKQETTPTCMPN